MDGPLRLHRAAEARGYPSLLLVTVGCLAMMVAAITLVALLVQWHALGFALLMLTVAIAALATELSAIFSDGEES